MDDQIPTRQLLARKRLSTISEWEEHEFAAERRANTDVSKTLRRSASERSPENELQYRRIQSKATGTKSPRGRSKLTAVLQAAYSECFGFESPLKGTPWEDAGSVDAVAQRRRRLLRRQRSTKEKECIDFWLKLFG